MKIAKIPKGPTLLLLLLCIGFVGAQEYPPSAGGGGGGGGEGVWGSITGTITDQTDLQNELDGKVDFPGSNGLITRTSPSTTTTRTVTSSDGSLTVSNGDGQAGNPDLVVDNSVYSRYTQGTGGAPGTCAVGTFHVETDDTQLYYCDSTDSQTEVGGGASFDPTSRTRIFSDLTANFLFGAGSPSLNLDFRSSANGTGADIAQASTIADGNHPGVFEYTTGITTSGRAGLYANSFVAGSGELVYETSVRLEDLSDGTDGYGVVVGFVDSPVTITEGIYVYYEDSLNSGKWQYTTESSSTPTDTDSGVTVAADTWYRIRIVVNSAASSVNFTINGVASADSTTNIPSGALNAWQMILKSSGTTTRDLYSDYILIEKDLTR